MRVQTPQGAEERLGADEAHGGGNFSESIGAVDEAPILDRDAHPDVRVPLQVRSEDGKPIVALVKILDLVPVRLTHDVEDGLDESVWDRLVEEVDIELTKMTRGRF